MWREWKKRAEVRRLTSFEVIHRMTRFAARRILDSTRVEAAGVPQPPPTCSSRSPPVYNVLKYCLGSRTSCGRRGRPESVATPHAVIYNSWSGLIWWSKWVPCKADGRAAYFWHGLLTRWRSERFKQLFRRCFRLLPWHKRYTYVIVTGSNSSSATWSTRNYIQ